MKYQRFVTVHINGVLVHAELVYDDPLRRDERMDELSLERLMGKLGEEDLEFLRDEFVQAGMFGRSEIPGDPNRTQYDDLECYDFADRIQDRLEIQRYGRTVTERTELDEITDILARDFDWRSER